MARHNLIGKWGEDIATEFLITKGYTIIERNWRIGNLEADIIATKGDRIIFIEVKTRSSEYADPLDAIDRRRQLRMVKIANIYIRSKRLKFSYQFDYVLIIGSPETHQDPKIEHIPDAFLAPLKTYR